MKKEILNEVINCLPECIQEFVNPSDCYDADDFIEECRHKIDENVEFVYKEDAIDFLTQNRDYFDDSISLAVERGLEIKDIDITLLGTILKRNIVFNQLMEEEDKIKDLFNIED